VACHYQFSGFKANFPLKVLLFYSCSHGNVETPDSYSAGILIANGKTMLC
jgi:hypothetical protein